MGGFEMCQGVERKQQAVTMRRKRGRDGDEVH